MIFHEFAKPSVIIGWFGKPYYVNEARLISLDGVDDMHRHYYIGYFAVCPRQNSLFLMMCDCLVFFCQICYIFADVLFSTISILYLLHVNSYQNSQTGQANTGSSTDYPAGYYPRPSQPGPASSQYNPMKSMGPGGMPASVSSGMPTPSTPSGPQIGRFGPRPGYPPNTPRGALSAMLSNSASSSSSGGGKFAVSLLENCDCIIGF